MPAAQGAAQRVDNPQLRAFILQNARRERAPGPTAGRAPEPEPAVDLMAYAQRHGCEYAVRSVYLGGSPAVAQAGAGEGGAVLVHYEGSWVGGRLHGLGTCCYVVGGVYAGKYTGEFDSDRRAGLGAFLFPDQASGRAQTRSATICRWAGTSRALCRLPLPSLALVPSWEYRAPPPWARLRWGRMIGREGIQGTESAGGTGARGLTRRGLVRPGMRAWGAAGDGLRRGVPRRQVRLAMPLSASRPQPRRFPLRNEARADDGVRTPASAEVS
jgi:hypothetical protein